MFDFIKDIQKITKKYYPPAANCFIMVSSQICQSL